RRAGRRLAVEADGFRRKPARRPHGRGRLQGPYRLKDHAMSHDMKPSFIDRHVGPGADDARAMLAALGVPSLETLISQTVPQSIRLDRALDLPAPASEAEALAELSEKMNRNKVLKSFIGAGYHGVHVPPVIQRNLFENPAWYTAYTPYQSEISQG